MTTERIPPWHAIEAAEVLRAVSSSNRGLSSEESARRLTESGPNELRQGEATGLFRLFLSQFKSLLVAILVVAAIIAGVSKEWSDCFTILAIVLANGLIGFYQEFNAEKALAALRRMTAPHARVRRDGGSTVVPAREIVVGDVVEIEAGDLVPADARLLTAAEFQTNEASLTGESVPVVKGTTVSPAATTLADRTDMVFMGTSAATGSAEAVVVATAMRTEIGRIAALIHEAGAAVETPLQARLRAFGRILCFASFAVVGLVFVLGFLRGLPTLELFLTSISLAVAAVPEGLPAVVTIALAVGVQRLAKRRSLIRRLHAVETLGSTNVICSDKTGTLTMGEMTVRAAFCDGSRFSISGEGYSPEGSVRSSEASGGSDGIAAARTLLTVMVAVNGAKLERKDDVWSVIGDPTEGALLAAAPKAGIDTKDLDLLSPIVRLFPFDSTRKRMTAIRKLPEGRARVYVKGAPDVLLDRCTFIGGANGIRPMTAEDRRIILEENNDLAGRALRVLAGAWRDIDDSDLPTRAEDAEKDLIFAGLVGMQDPPRADAKAAVATCRKAGIRVVMITGDHPLTAKAIAREIGILDATHSVLTGDELSIIDDSALRLRIENIAVFARVTAEHKLRIVRAWQEGGAVVAMTGDGINDAPALKGADIGIAMGVAGTEVAKEASAMVIADDRFATIVDAVQEGRGVYENIKRTLQYLLAGNAGELLLMTAAVIVGVPIPLLPIQLLWINLVTDGLPALCLAVEPIDGEVMLRPPRPKGDRLADRGFVATMAITGVLTSAVSFGAYLYALPREDLAMARAHAFGVLVIAELLRSFGCRSETKTIWELGFRSNTKLAVVVVISLLIQWWSHRSGFLESFLKTPEMPWGHSFVLFVFGAIPLLVMEGVKVIRRSGGSS